MAVENINTILIRRGVEADRLAYTPLDGELIWSRDAKKLFIGDGTTAGGIDVMATVTDNLGTIATYNQGNGAGEVPILDANGKFPSSTIPSIGITDVFPVADETAMLALSDAAKGDIAIREDENATYILAGDDYSDVADWVKLRTPTDAVLSVNGKTGVVTIDKADIGLDRVENKSVAEILASAALTGTPTTPTAAADSNDQTVANTQWVNTYVTTELANYMLIDSIIDGGRF